MPWIAPAVGIGGSLVGGLFGGSEKSPMRKFRDFYSEQLYGPGGFGQAMARNRNAWNDMYQNLISMSQGLGKKEITGIKNWKKNTMGEADQSLMNRGLFNTTVTDSVHSDIGRQAKEMKQGVRESNLQRTMGLILGQRQQQDRGLNQWWDWQRQLAFGPPGGASYQAPQQDYSGIGGLFGQVAGGLFGRGGTFNPYPTGSPTVTGAPNPWTHR